MRNKRVGAVVAGLCFGLVAALMPFGQIVELADRIGVPVVGFDELGSFGE